MMRKSILTIFAFAVSAATLFAKFEFDGTCDKDALSYKCGDTAVFSVSLLDDGKPVKGGATLFWRADAEDGSKPLSGKFVCNAEPLVVKKTCAKPGFVRFQVYAKNADGKPILDGRNRALRYDGGAGFCVAKISNPVAEPKDFDVFWNKQKDMLAKVPMEVVQKVLPNDKFEIKELTIKCIGKPAKAYLTIPKGAKAGSLPLRVFVHGWGVGRINPNLSGSAITLSIARHSYELGQDKQYYEKYKNGELKRFGLDAADLQTPQKVYYRDMLLRDLRALEFAKKSPQWNGKEITVSGGSMGGFQSIFLAYLDPQITLCRPHIPWLCDIWAYRAGDRAKSEFAPAFTEAMPYFDSSFAIKRVKCPVEITAWLGDYVCPPSGVIVAFNNAPKGTKLLFGQDGRHEGRGPSSAKHHWAIEK